MKTPAVIAGAAALAVAILTGGAGEANQPAADTRPSWRTPQADLARGEELAQACLTCHAEDSPRTDPPAPKLHHQRQSYLFFALLAYRDGNRKSDLMAPFAQGLSDQDARDVAAYLAGDMFDRPPPAPTQLPGYAFTARECTLCHGETGIGEMEGMPVITGQNREYLTRALEEYGDGRRGDPTMRSIVRDLSPDRAAEAVEYYSAMDWLTYNR